MAPVPPPVACLPALSIDLPVRARATPHVAGLRLGDLADVSRLPAPLRARAAALPLPWRARRPTAIPAAMLVAAVRARLPVLRCARLRIAGDTVRLDPAPTMPVSPIARQAVAGIAAGDTLTLVTRFGPVRVERAVTALQPAGDGGRLFVRDADGKLISARYAGAAQ